MEQFPFHSLGKSLIIIGAIIIVIGIIVLLSPKIPWLGKLPGDISIKGKNTTFYFPIVTSLVLSVILTIILNLFFRK
ncbi:MAG: DUF2905 domain-containing protein [Candidatus Zixiibacteriota bacterium]